jgi:hypothetical protein
MYSTCIYCNASLGTNEAVESFPVGRRLAFDAARGRLWVVCRACARWNLTPLEARWEAVEACERLFRATPTRYSTPQIGLARVRSGVDLVRVGRPERPEFAAWRYGRQFATRRRRSLALSGSALGLMAVHLVGPGTIALFAGGVPIGLALLALTWAPVLHANRRAVTRVRMEGGELRLLRGRDIVDVRLVPADEAPGWRFQVRGERATIELLGDDALVSAGQVLAHLNLAGAPEKVVQSAVRELERVPRPDDFFAATARALEGLPHSPAFAAERFELGKASEVTRLALEMAAHESVERRALEGELRLLESAWREAEEIAALADGLLRLPRLSR